MVIRAICNECGRKATRQYNGKYLCEFHYLKENPERNKNNVDWDKLYQMKLTNPQIAFLIDIRKKKP